MTYDLLLGLISFAFVTSITPGPNNLMLLASGANFGFLRTLPHMIGINLGFATLAAAAGFGLSALLIAIPTAKLALKIAACAYMLWLAWKIAHSGAPGAGRVGLRPMTARQAALFQWVNPKAWAMALGAVVAYGGDGGLWSIGLVVVVFCAVNLPSIASWVLAGEVLRRVLSAPGRLRAFNVTMAVLLVLSMWPVIGL